MVLLNSGAEMEFTGTICHESTQNIEVEEKKKR